MDMTDSRLKFAKPEPRAVTKKRHEKIASRDERACRAFVQKRDKGRCVVPGCIQRGAEMHHVIPRSHSRRLKWATSNNCLLCQEHHALRHAGVIQISGDANDELVITGDISRLRFRL